MAKAGLGKGHALTRSPRPALPTYANIELERRAARQRERAHSLKEKAMIGKYMEEEASVKAIIDEYISDKRVRDRVKKDIGIGLIHARRGHDPLGGKLSCDRCARPGHETHHFLCLKIQPSGPGSSILGPAGGLRVVGLSFTGLLGLISGAPPFRTLLSAPSNAACCCSCAPPRRLAGPSRSHHHHPSPGRPPASIFTLLTRPSAARASFLHPPCALCAGLVRPDRARLSWQ